MQEDEGVDARELPEGAAHRALEAAVVELGHEVGHDLGVGLGDEAVARALQALLQGQVVLDDAVVDDHDLSGRVLVRVGVLLGGPAVGGPSGVADAVLTGDRRGREDLLQGRSLPAARRRSRTPSCTTTTPAES